MGHLSHSTGERAEIFPHFWCGAQGGDERIGEGELDGRGRAALRALRDVLDSPALRRLQLAWVGSILGGWAYLVALGVYAYGEGGAAAVGLVGPDPAGARRDSRRRSPPRSSTATRASA